MELVEVDNLLKNILNLTRRFREEAQGKAGDV